MEGSVYLQIYKHLYSMLMITAANMDMIFTELFNFLQHVKGPTHEKGHTLDLVFSLGLNIDQLCVKDSHVITAGPSGASPSFTRSECF